MSKFYNGFKNIVGLGICCWTCYHLKLRFMYCEPFFHSSIPIFRRGIFAASMPYFFRDAVSLWFYYLHEVYTYSKIYLNNKWLLWFLPGTIFEENPGCQALCLCLWSHQVPWCQIWGRLQVCLYIGWSEWPSINTTNSLVTLEVWFPLDISWALVSVVQDKCV